MCQFICIFSLLLPGSNTTISVRLDKNQYKTVGDFVYDLRLIAANCLQYNTTVNDSFRPVAIDFLSIAEDLCKFFIAKNEPTQVYPSLLYCWADCVKSITELINMTNPDDNHQTAWFFLQPVTYFCGGQYPEGEIDFESITCILSFCIMFSHVFLHGMPIAKYP